MEQQDKEQDPQEAVKLSRAEGIFVRLSFWQTVLSVVGVFIAVLALYAALTESEEVRKQTAAAVWPYVQATIQDFDTGTKAGFVLSLTNVGVGPARMRNVRVLIKGKAVKNWQQAVTELGGEWTPAVGKNAIYRRVLSPGQRVELISVADTDLARAFREILQQPGNALTYCYCSIFDDCWLADIREMNQDPVPVEQCASFGADEFME